MSLPSGPQEALAPFSPAALARWWLVEPLPVSPAPRDSFSPAGWFLQAVFATTPSLVVVAAVIARRRPRRQHSRSRVALPLCGRPCGLRRHLSLALSSVIIVWSSPSSAVRRRVVVVDPRLFSRPSSCSATGVFRKPEPVSAIRWSFVTECKSSLWTE